MVDVSNRVGWVQCRCLNPCTIDRAATLHHNLHRNPTPPVQLFHKH